MLRNFVFVDADMSVFEAEEFMDECRLDAVPVLNPDRTIFGLLTQKNLAQFHRRPLNNPRAFHAWEICDSRPLATSAVTPVEEIVGQLLETNGSHALVIDDNRQLVGVITTDLLLDTLSPASKTRFPQRAPKGNNVLGDRRH